MGRRPGIFFPTRFPNVHAAAKERLGARYGWLFLFALVTGGLVGLASIALHHGVGLVGGILYEQSFRLGESDTVFRGAPWYLLLAGPAIGGLAVGLLAQGLAPEVRYSGIPNIMVATTLGDGRIRKRVAPLKLIAGALTPGSGGSAGREGPIAYIGAALGSMVGQFGKLGSHDLKILVACGASSGIAATFNAPLGGVMFSLEMFLTEFSTRAFIPIVAATVFSTVVTYSFLEQPAILGTPLFGLESAWELLLYLALGLIAAVIGVLFIQALHGFDSFASRLKAPVWVLPALGGLAVGVIALGMDLSVGRPYIMGVGYGTVTEMLAGSIEVRLLLALLAAKLVATSLTYSSGGAGGVFGPCLFLGAAMGASFGELAQHVTWFPVAAPGAYALVGMAALFAGASRATMTSILIVFEITGTYDIILPLMFACVASDGLSVALSRHTLYTRKLEKQGLHYAYDRTIDPLVTLLCGEVATVNVFTVRSDETVDAVVRRTESTTHRGFPVVDAKTRALVGIVTKGDLVRALGERKGRASIGAVMTRKPVTVSAEQPLTEALRRMTDFEVGRLPVVSPVDETKLVGILSRTDILRAHRRQERRLRGVD